MHPCQCAPTLLSRVDLYLPVCNRKHTTASSFGISPVVGSVESSGSNNSAEIMRQIFAGTHLRRCGLYPGEVTPVCFKKYSLFKIKTLTGGWQLRLHPLGKNRVQPRKKRVQGKSTNHIFFQKILSNGNLLNFGVK